MVGEQHKLFCLKCGKEAIPIFRKKGRNRAKGHLKKMYCPWCKDYMNHYEARNEQEEKEFLEKFAAGEFEELAKVSEEYIESKRVLL